MLSLSHQHYLLVLVLVLVMQTMIGRLLAIGLLLRAMVDLLLVTMIGLLLPPLMLVVICVLVSYRSLSVSYLYLP